MTPREAAKKMILYSVTVAIQDGNSIERCVHDLAELCLGSCNEEYRAAIGGYHPVNGNPRKLKPDQLIVRDIKRVPCGQIFSLKDLVEELYDEIQNGKQLSLWEVSA